MVHVRIIRSARQQRTLWFGIPDRKIVIRCLAGLSALSIVIAFWATVAAAQSTDTKKEFLEIYERDKYLPNFNTDPGQAAARDRAACLETDPAAGETWEIFSSCNRYEDFLLNDGPCSTFMNIPMCEGKEAISRDLELSILYLRRAKLYRLPGEDQDLDQSIADFTSAIDLFYRELVEFAQEIGTNPPALEALLERARTYGVMGKLELAEKDLDRLLGIWPEHPLPWFEKARLAIAREDFSQSVAFLNQTIVLSPRFAQAYYLRAFSAHRLGRGKQAVEDCRRAEELDATIQCSQ